MSTSTEPARTDEGGLQYRTSPVVQPPDVDGELPVWADPVALLAENESDRSSERRLYLGLLFALTVTALLWGLRLAFG